MSSGILLLEFALLGFIALVYLLARRNLTAAAAREQAGMAQSLLEVQETVASLISVLKQEAAVIDERLSERMRQIERVEAQERAAPLPPIPASLPLPAARAPMLQRPTMPEPSASANAPTPLTAVERALQLIAGGESTLSAARQTALTVTEVEMAARMRGVQPRK